MACQGNSLIEPLDRTVTTAFSVQHKNPHGDPFAASQHPENDLAHLEKSHL
jgi:hypothetical protein